MIKIDQLKFNDKGLIPAIIQEVETYEILMLAYMNRKSLEITLKEKRTCFFSRSRQTLWRKGETSGHIQKVKEIWIDCDYDSLVIRVEQVGPACHTKKHSCFFNKTPIS